MLYAGRTCWTVLAGCWREFIHYAIRTIITCRYIKYYIENELRYRFLGYQTGRAVFRTETGWVDPRFLGCLLY